MSSNELAEEESIVASGLALRPDDVPLATPLSWPIVDEDGALLRERGASIASEDERSFLFAHFKPRRKETTVAGATSATAAGRRMSLARLTSRRPCNACPARAASGKLTASAFTN